MEDDEVAWTQVFTMDSHHAVRLMKSRLVTIFLAKSKINCTGLVTDGECV